MTQPARRQPFALSVLLGAILLSGQAMAAVLAEEAQLLDQLSAAERAMLLELLRKVARQRKT